MKRPYTSYKTSGVEWLCDVPEHWELKRLKYLATTNDESLSETEDPLRSIAYVDIGSVDSSAGITDTEAMVFEDAPSRARRLVRDGDSIISTVRTYLRAIAPISNPTPEMVVSTGFAVIRPRKVDSRFATWALREQGFVEEIVARSTGVSYPAINATQIGNLVIPLPPPTEQQAVASFLDHETAQIDTLIAKKQQLIERLAEYRTALITRTVTRGLPPDAAEAAGLDPAPPLRASGVEWLGDVPEHWTAVRISAVARPGDKSFTDGDWVELPYITDSGVRLIQTGNIGIGEYREQGYRYIDESSFDELRCTEVDPGDVLICRLADPVGRACRAPDLGVRMITSVDVCILKPSEQCSSAYLTYLLSSKGYLSYVESLVRGGTRDRISRSMLGAIKIPNPPCDEQHAIAAFLDHQMEAIDLLSARVETAIERLQEYRMALITAAVTGKIDVRDRELAEPGARV